MAVVVQVETMASWAVNTEAVESTAAAVVEKAVAVVETAWGWEAALVERGAREEVVVWEVARTRQTP